MVFHCSLSDNKSFQLSRTFLSILIDRINAVDWICLGSFSDFQLFQSLHQAFENRFEFTNFNLLLLLLLLLKFFSPALANGLSQESE